MQAEIITAACAAAVFAVAAFAAFFKLSAIRRTLSDVCETLKFSENSNVVIGAYSRDKVLRKTVAALNRELERLREAYRTYERGNKDLDTAIVNMAHDIRTPLTSAKGWLELCDSAQDFSKCREYILHIKESVEHMRELTEELFGYALAYEQPETDIEKLDCAESLRRSALSFYGAFRREGREPDINIPDKPVWIAADKRMLERIFDNVFSNAVKYGRDNLEISLSEDGVTEIKNKCDTLDYIDVERMFDRFFTVKNAKSSSGLGLSIARLLTVRSGGKISAYKEDGSLTVRIDLSAVRIKP